MTDVTVHAEKTVMEPERSMMRRGLLLNASALSLCHVDEFCVILNSIFHGDQVVRDEFMNDTDAESQALAAQCLQVQQTCSMPHSSSEPAA